MLISDKHPGSDPGTESGARRKGQLEEVEEEEEEEEGVLVGKLFLGFDGEEEGEERQRKSGRHANASSEKMKSSPSKPEMVSNPTVGSCTTV